jgi:hypothetical protein
MGGIRVPPPQSSPARGEEARPLPITHLKGHGGLKGAVRAVRDAVPWFRFVLKMDVRSYDASALTHCDNG